MDEEKKTTPAEQPQPPAPLSDARKAALLRYMAILFAVAFLLVLLSLILKSRSAEEEKLQRIHVGMDQVLTHMLLHFNEPVDLDLYAGMCYVSKNRFIHLFRDYTGMPPYRYQLKIRMDCARELLENTPISVKECAQAVGFGDISYFCRVFRKFTGHTPTWYCSKLAAARLPEPGDSSLFGQNKE